MTLDEKQTQDSRTLEDIADELRRDQRAERRDSLCREFIENSWRMTSASPEGMELLIEAFILDTCNRPQFPSLLRMFQDVAHPEQAIAERCRDHMLNALQNGQSLGIRLALGNLEELAAEIIYSPKAEWSTDV